MRWKQVGGDVNPKEYGAVLARIVGDYVEIVEIDPEAQPGLFWVQRADIPLEDLSWTHNRDVARSHGHSKADWESMSMEHRAEDRLGHWGAYHLGGDQRTEKLWSKALPAPSRSIVWW